jgi:hypothetical protein
MRGLETIAKANSYLFVGLTAAPSLALILEISPCSVASSAIFLPFYIFGSLLMLILDFITYATEIGFNLSFIPRTIHYALFGLLLPLVLSLMYIGRRVRATHGVFYEAKNLGWIQLTLSALLWVYLISFLVYSLASCFIDILP